MILYRIVTKRANALLSGRGAARSKVNRWNSEGTELLYTSETKELAIAELSSHVPPGLLPDPHLMIIELSSEAHLTELKEEEYPLHWDSIPPADRSKRLGDRFVSDMQFVALKVRSRHGSTAGGNVLLNPNHPDFSKFVSVKEVIQLKKPKQ